VFPVRYELNSYILYESRSYAGEENETFSSSDWLKEKREGGLFMLDPVVMPHGS
jgi:hypothetical protein